MQTKKRRPQGRPSHRHHRLLCPLVAHRNRPAGLCACHARPCVSRRPPRRPRPRGPRHPASNRQRSQHRCPETNQTCQSEEQPTERGTRKKTQNTTNERHRTRTTKLDNAYTSYSTCIHILTSRCPQPRDLTLVRPPPPVRGDSRPLVSAPFSAGPPRLCLRPFPAALPSLVRLGAPLGPGRRARCPSGW